MRQVNQYVGQKWENPEKNLVHPQVELALFLMCHAWAQTHTRHNSEIIELLSVVIEYQCSLPLGHGNRLHTYIYVSYFFKIFTRRLTKENDLA